MTLQELNALPVYLGTMCSKKDQWMKLPNHLLSPFQDAHFGPFYIDFHESNVLQSAACKYTLVNRCRIDGSPTAKICSSRVTILPNGKIDATGPVGRCSWNYSYIS